MRRTIFACTLVSIASILGTIALFFAYAVISDALRPPPGYRVAFSELLAELDHGRIDEIQVDGRAYRFRVHDQSSGRTVEHEAYGPALKAAQVEQLRPADPSRPAPQVTIR